jgi:hypothetical protein
MMDRSGALKQAINLLHFPSQVQSIRSAPLPNDVLILLRIVAGDEEATSQAARSTGRSRDTVRDAANFFIEQVMLSPSADSYRVLGASPQASLGEIRRNMALLLRWLHPDHDRRGERSVFAARVTRAWNDLKTKERREIYDRSVRPSPSPAREKQRTRAQSTGQGPNRRWVHVKRYNGPRISRLASESGNARGLLHRILSSLFARIAL